LPNSIAFAYLPCCFWSGRIGTVGRSGRKIGTTWGESGLLGKIGHPLVYFRQIQPLNLGEQIQPPVRIQLLPEGQKMALSTLLQRFFNVFVSFLSVHILDSKLEKAILGELQKIFKRIEKFVEIRLTDTLMCANITV
jgi:hypothetical protein